MKTLKEQMENSVVDKGFFSEEEIAETARLPPNYKAQLEESDEKIRAEKLDEGLDLLTTFWSGEKVTFKGIYYQVDGVVFQPPPKTASSYPNLGGWLLAS